ncbi:MAG: hypothetical protein DHS20C01_10830 [marine bacterium B5-7]|nr:MAG: hypothetical protein DHS20C01_10830 [marine bacterium B5-7]
MTETSALELEQQIHKLKQEHQALDTKLGSMVNDPLANDLEIQALKRQKLQLKDTIISMKNQLEG